MPFAFGIVPECCSHKLH